MVPLSLGGIFRKSQEAGREGQAELNFFFWWENAMPKYEDYKKLLLWTAHLTRPKTAEALALSLTVEGVASTRSLFPDHFSESLTAFRRLNWDARVRACKRALAG